MTNVMSEIVVSGGFRIFLANQLIALGWALKGCKPCEHRLFSTARWLVPEARRFLVQRTGPHTRNRRLFSRQTPHMEDQGMKRRLSQAAFDTYVANPECAAYLKPGCPRRAAGLPCWALREHPDPIAGFNGKERTQGESPCVSFSPASWRRRYS